MHAKAASIRCTATALHGADILGRRHRLDVFEDLVKTYKFGEAGGKPMMYVTTSGDACNKPTNETCKYAYRLDKTPSSRCSSRARARFSETVCANVGSNALALYDTPALAAMIASTTRLASAEPNRPGRSGGRSPTRRGRA